MSRAKQSLNMVVGLIGLVALVWLVIIPLYKLLHLGVREHGSFTEDLDFYYTLVAMSLVKLGEAAGITLCLIGMTCAFSSVLGFSVKEAARERARTWFWYAPVFCFFLELLGRYQVQSWYANRGILFPVTSFLV